MLRPCLPISDLRYLTNIFDKHVCPLALVVCGDENNVKAIIHKLGVCKGDGVPSRESSNLMPATEMIIAFHGSYPRVQAAARWVVVSNAMILPEFKCKISIQLDSRVKCNVVCSKPSL